MNIIDTANMKIIVDRGESADDTYRDIKEQFSAATPRGAHLRKYHFPLTAAPGIVHTTKGWTLESGMFYNGQPVTAWDDFSRQFEPVDDSYPLDQGDVFE